MEKLLSALLGMSLACLLAGAAAAATHYVVPPGTADVTPTDPYADWATAGTSIIDVVNAAFTNAEPRLVWVTNGIYYFTNGVNITNALTLQSMNGRSNTICNGNAPGMSNYAFYLSCPAGATGILDGFTVSNFYFTNVYVGSTYTGGGTIIGKFRAIIKNCLITDNVGKTAAGSSDAGGINLGTVYGYSKITNCIVRRNQADRCGGGIVLGDDSQILDTLIEDNAALYLTGGGIYVSGARSIISNCVIINNRACDGGGIYVATPTYGGPKILSCLITGNWVYGKSGSYTGKGGGIKGNITYYSDSWSTMIVANCTIQGNSATDAGGGIYGQNFILRNNLISGNTALTNSGGVWCRFTSVVESCTIVSNSAGVSGGGLSITNDVCSGINNVIYHNTAPDAANYTNAAGNTGLSYCCVFPAVDGTGNITNVPRLVDLAGGNYRLAADSPCMNRGTNMSWMTNAVDLDGNRHRRIQYGTVDMGAYERINEGTVYGVH